MIRPTCQIRSILIITSYLREPYQVLSYLSAVTGGPVAIYETCVPHYSSVYQMPYSSSTAPLQSHLPSAPCIPLSACGKRSFKSSMHFSDMFKGVSGALIHSHVTCLPGGFSVMRYTNVLSFSMGLKYNEG